MSDPYASFATPVQRVDPYAAFASPAAPRQAKPADNSRARGFGLGAVKPLDSLTSGLNAAAEWATAHVPFGGTIDRLGQRLGLPSTAQASAVVKADIAQRDASRQANTRTGYQTLGNIAGTLPTTAMKGGQAVQGAVSGALLSDRPTLAGRAYDAGVGAVTSVVGGKVLSSLGAVARPIASKAANALHDAGVMLSPGQLAQSAGGTIGKYARKAEDMARSVPVLSAFVGGSRDRAATQLNHAVVNDALAPIGKKANAALPAGHDLLDHAGNQLSAQYKSIVPRLVGHIDDTFGEDLAAATAHTNTLPPATQKQFGNIVQDVFTNRVEGGRTISGQNLKDAESALGVDIRDYAKAYQRNSHPDDRKMGDALVGVRDALRSLAIRGDSESGNELQAVNTGWAKLAQARKAADQNGVITPGRLVRQANKSGHGTELARAASELLPDHVPNSGTADRVAMMKLLSASQKGVGAGGLAYGMAAHPVAAAAAAAATLPYTQVGQRALNSIAFKPRAKLVQQGGRLLQSLAKTAPAIAPAVVADRSQ